MPKKYYSTLLLTILSPVVCAKYLPPTIANKGMVVSEQKIASQVGVDILKAGGNAIDAAVATGYALAVVDPCCGNIGGGGFMLIHLKSGKNIGLNFRETAPKKIKSSLFFSAGKKTKASTLGYLSVGVPGTVMGLNSALKKYGTLSLKQVMQPAILLAKNGFILSTNNAQFFNHEKKLFSSTKNTQKIFFPDNQKWHAGDRFIQKDLAKTLSMISLKGARYFYQGPIAQAIVTASEKAGGVLSLQDFHHYHIRWVTPIHCEYRKHTIVTMPLPSSGTTVCQILSILNTFPFPKNGFHSSTVTHINTAAMQLAFHDRNQYLGDPRFTPSATRALLSSQHIKKQQEEIRHSIIHIHLNPQTTTSPKEKLETTHYSTYDKEGNAVSVTYTLNGFFGSKKIAGNTGFFLNNELDDFALKKDLKNQFHLKQGDANLIAPNKQPLSSMSPTLVFNHHQLIMILGAAGGPTIITQIVQTIENVLDFDMNIQAAINSPHYHRQDSPATTFYEPQTFSLDTLKALKLMKNHLEKYLWGKYPTWGQQAAILIDPSNHLIFGANDARRPDGAAIGLSKKCLKPTNNHIQFQ